MPLYEYHCHGCSADFFLLQKMGTTAAETRCPECGAATVEKRISVCSIGSGGSAPSAAPPGCSMGGG